MIGRARILKANAQTATLSALDPTATPAKPVVREAVFLAQQQAQVMKAQALQECQTLLHKAREQAESLKRQAFEEGFKDGQAQALADCLKFQQAEQQADERAQERILVLAQVLAERLVGHALTLDPSLVRDMTQQVLHEARGARRVELRMHPADAKLFEQEFTAPLHLNLTLLPDAALSRGELKLKTNIGELDTSLGSRLALLVEKLRESFGTPNASE